jgi:hypothetical protein
MVREITIPNLNSRFLRVVGIFLGESIGRNYGFVMWITFAFTTRFSAVEL